MKRPVNRPITPRQAEVAALVVQGVKDKRIARKLGISPRTVEDHKHSAYLRLGSQNIIDLARELILRDPKQPCPCCHRPLSP